MMSNEMAISIALFAIGPAVSSISCTGMIPSREMRPLLGFNVKTLALDAGIMSEPHVSVPSDIGAKPAATEAALPEDEPPGPYMKNQTTFVTWVTALDDTHYVRQICLSDPNLPSHMETAFVLLLLTIHRAWHCL